MKNNSPALSNGFQASLRKDDSLILECLSMQIKLTPHNKSLIKEFSHSFEMFEGQIGDSLGDFLSASANNTQQEQNSQYFYLICQGRLRLLSFDAEKQREVSVQLLTEGDTFGIDALFCEVSLTYRAIAASKVRVARISQEKLQPFLAREPELQKKCLTVAQHRQRLIFFKTATVLRSLPSHRLQQICPYLLEKRIAKGESLAQAATPETGRFWLRRGKIQNHPSPRGLDWGYPVLTPVDWVTQTDLLVYQLPQQNWEAVTAIAPILDSSKSESGVEALNGHKTDAIVLRHKPTPPTPSRISQTGNPPNSLLPKVEEEPKSPEIEFPKPLKRKLDLWRNYPFIEQQSSSDCGATCLAMISQYWGKRFSINTLRDLSGVGRSGASLQRLSKAAESLGYQARPVRASLSRLVDRKNPWIAHWQGDHYVVVYWIKGDKVLVADPAKGKYRLSRQDFVAGWTGYALLPEPTERLYETPNEKRSLSRFIHLLWPYRSLGLQIILASILIQVFGLISPLFTQIIVDQVMVNKSQSTLNVFVLGALMFGIGAMLLSSIRKYLLSYFSNRLDLTMIGGFINYALKLPLNFFESRRVGDITTRVQENQKIQRFLIGQVLLSWLNFLTGFVYLGLMLYYNWQLTVLVLALIPPIVILTLGATPLLRKISRERFNAAADQNSSLVEMMTGVSTVKAAAAEQELRWRWEDSLTHQLNVRFKGQKLAINLGLLSGLINSIGGTALLWYGATLVIQGQLTIGQYVAFNMMKGHIISPVIALVGLWDELQEVLISVERLNDVFDTEPEETSANQMLTLPPIRGDVRLQDVVFRYETDEQRNVLQNISFEVKAGQTVAIVGRSGSGKTTLVKLLQSLYYPTNGNIWIDDHDLQHVSPQSLRSQLGVVPQECFLFSGTILENITLYRPEFSLDRVIEVAKLAEAHAFIQGMPLGYNTKVGERGTNLSGGQRQRIAIARALLGEPRILILDEATSSLDTESERRFQQNLARLARDRTTFIIAHRLSTVHNADCILVLDRGLLVEKGTHEELMSQQGLYYYLAQQQLDL
ncbi:ABC transporter transmembrane domain-containing protein [Pleurocapsa sp. PCC 7319]|uniref:ABC transporter transmembrane domain-containing protein n=1 Tax=Pleurocapsa sp. PCC 7319 TaxID=118161 RepID=UPI00036F4366|nr:peptidase domain-containing ABC transporter [Pleurocapsa sp. PCC 7319]